MEKNKPQVNLLIPLYNEEEVYDKLIERLTNVIEKTTLDVSVILVDDGSKDKTPFFMRETALKDERFSAVFLSRNFGHQLALTAGLTCINATEAVLILDGDLQDPPELLDKFYAYYKEGYDVVYAERSSNAEKSFKRLTSRWFYQLFDRMTETKIPLNTGDFALISRRVADILNQMPEERRFIRGMRSWVGFKQKGIFFDRPQREYGETKYPLTKMLRLALDGIFSFSEVPIKLIINLGILAVLSSFIFLTITLYRKFYLDVVGEGFTALIFAITLFGGVQLISIGVLGEYIVRIFFQVKERPLFIIESRIEKQKEINGQEIL
ncbi:glycosyltransferase family 2 protein [Aureispira sp. CCB-E]|uniref:glycosyltransferase family 2 protein n=1 Tax=Aureispira sp. CCB-E TaxID=3051121 RepID=UPI0028692FE1|nr:glycosyltransferase family 2 protein [Aureispira sp. CCB-E]WMX14150.1 glycosyltransferase family 2 protein [Aureispira sp. CCB-E]